MPAARSGGARTAEIAAHGFKAKVEAPVTKRVGKDVARMPFHFGAWFGGVDLRGSYLQGADPVVLVEAQTRSRFIAMIRRPAPYVVGVRR
ncbi:MAG: hypothetical protein JO081_08190 [Alphaproteobacteria bacterium]|nr:hypothetical protein [Alphaproteobacteria bacterium]